MRFLPTLGVQAPHYLRLPPSSNGRAEQAVKITKRLLENNTGPNAELNTDKVVCALLQQKNTPDRDCGLSPAETFRVAISG